MKGSAGVPFKTTPIFITGDSGRMDFLHWITQRFKTVYQHFTETAKRFQDPHCPLRTTAANLNLTTEQLLQIFLFLADKTLARCVAAYYQDQIRQCLPRIPFPEIRDWVRLLPQAREDWLCLSPFPPLPHTLLCSTFHSIMASTLGQPVDCLLCYRFCVLAGWEPLDEERFSGRKKGTGAWFWSRIKKTLPA